VHLNAQQAIHLKRVRTADEAWRHASRDALARAKLLAEEEVASFLAARDHEIRLAFESGVPKKRLYQEGLLTTSSKTLEESLRRTEAMAEQQRHAAEANAPERYRWTGERDQFGRPTFIVSMAGDTDWLAWVDEKRRNKQLRSAELMETTTALFYVDDQGQVGTMEYDMSGAVMVDHPVVAWHKRERFQDATGWVGANPMSAVMSDD
jgi:hypothetical protein